MKYTGWCRHFNLQNFTMNITPNLCVYSSLTAKMNRKYLGPYVLHLEKLLQLKMYIKKLTIQSKDLMTARPYRLEHTNCNLSQAIIAF